MTQKREIIERSWVASKLQRAIKLVKADSSSQETTEFEQYTRESGRSYQENSMARVREITAAQQARGSGTCTRTTGAG